MALRKGAATKLNIATSRNKAGTLTIDLDQLERLYSRARRLRGRREDRDEPKRDDGDGIRRDDTF